MQPTIVFLAVLLIGVNSQNFEDIFDLNMGIPNHLAGNCPEGNPQCSSNNDHMIESIFDMNMETPKSVKPDICPDLSNPVCSSNSQSSVKTASDTSAASDENLPRCGYRNVNGIGSSTKTMDSSEAHFGEFPWVVAILKAEQTRRMILDMYKGTGSLIHPKVVLTAAHNVLSGKSAEYKARAGEWDPHDQSEDLPHQDRQISYRIIHPRFNRRNLWFDVTLLILDQPFDLMPNINTICLAPLAQSVESSPCYMNGWGIQADSKDPPNVLKRVELTVRPHQQCERDLRAAMAPRLNFTLHNSFMCAGGDLNKDSCFGDGGAPLVCPIANTTNRYYQAGIVSWGLECGQENVPGVYTNIRIVQPWIQDQLSRRGIHSHFYLAE